MKAIIIKKVTTVCILSIIIFTACSSFVKKDVKENTADSPLSKKYDEHLTISIGYWNIDNLSNKEISDELMQYIENLFNITIQPVSVTWSNYKERYQILSATNSLPDVFTTLTLSSSDNNDSALLTDMIKNGSIRALPEDLSRYPNMESLMDSVSYTRYLDGQYYAIPRTSFTDSVLGTTDAVMLVRKDWMNHLGLKNPESFDDFLSMTAAFANKDPDGNGIDDTIGYNVNKLSALGKWVMLGIAPECNVYTWIQKEDQYVPSWATENFKAVVCDYRRLYEAGGLDPDFYSKSPSAVMEDFSNNKLGTLEYKTSPSTIMEIKALWDANNTKPFEDCVDFLPIFPAPNGVRYSNSSSSFWSESLISSAVTDEKLERIIALYEFLLSKEGTDLCRFGIPQVDFTKSESGYQILIDTKGKSLITALTEKYPSFSLFSSLATWAAAGMISKKITLMIQDMVRNVLHWREMLFYGILKILSRYNALTNSYYTRKNPLIFFQPLRHLMHL